MNSAKLAIVCLCIMLVLEIQYVDSRKRGGRRKHHKKRHTKPEVDIENDVHPCLKTTSLKKKFQNRWLKSFALLNKDTNKLINILACKFEPDNCKLPRISSYRPVLHRVQVSCAAEYITNVLDVLDGFHRNLTRINEALVWLQKDLKMSHEDILTEPTNVLLNDIANTVVKYAGGLRRHNKKISSTPITSVKTVTSVKEFLTSFLFFLKDFHIFVNNVVSVIKLR